jgi:PAS domain S-box-containing protein
VIPLSGRPLEVPYSGKDGLSASEPGGLARLSAPAVATLTYSCDTLGDQAFGGKLRADRGQGGIMAYGDLSDLERSTCPAQWQAVLGFAMSRSSAVFYVRDLTGERPIRFISANVEAITGHKPAAFLEEPGFGRSQMYPEDLPRHDRCLNTLQERSEASLEYRFAVASGEYRWFREDLRLIESPGQTPQYVGCMIDITARVTAESQSRQWWCLLRDALDSVPNSFAIYDAQERLILCNMAFATAFGDWPESLAGTTVSDNARRFLAQAEVFDGEAVTDPEAMHPRALARLRDAHRNPIDMRLKSGTWLQITSHPTSNGGRVYIRTDITRLKHAEKSLRESEEHFRSIVEGNPSPVRVTDLDTTETLYESPAAAALLGRVDPDEKCTPLREAHVDPKVFDNVIVALKANGRVDGREIELKRADGTKFWAAWSSQAVRFQGRDVAVCSLVDLTESKRREAELLDSRETLDGAIEALNEGFALYDANDRLVMCNARYRAMNKPAAEFLVPGVTWREASRMRAESGLFPEAEGQIEQWIERRAKRRARAAAAEIPLSNGRWVQATYRRMRQGGLVHVWRDITERRKMEQDLRESEARIRQVLEACPVPITLNRADDGVILYENPAAQALIKYPEGESVATVLPRWTDIDERRTYIERLQKEGAVNGFETRYRKADGEEFPVAISSRLIDYRGQDVIVANIMDLTDRHAAEAELTRQREMLHQSEKLSALGELLAGVAHELNNPLSVLVGQALMLREDATDSRTAVRADKMGKAADRCARIVKTFLAMARQEPNETEPVDLNFAIENALEVTAYPLRTSGVDVVLRLAKELPCVMANDDQMRQVFTNLIVNAQNALQDKEGPKKLRITSSYRQRSDQIVVKLKDNGPGIPEEIRSRIFEPLFTTKDVGAGTGMGLALCHRIIEAHGGTIVLERASGDGSVFTIRLPRAKMEALPDAETWTEEPNNNGYRILVVDDEYDVGRIISDALERDGHTVEIARSGTVAMEKIKFQPYDVILSDIRMPGMDGPGLYRALSAARPDQIDRLAFITGDTLTPRVREFLVSSERPYLEKPVRPKDVRNLVDLLMRRKVN